ncbi:MAG: hypothetical protein Q9220_005436 [cf. Caloplaca sp. 1 TL-2023]
MARQHPRRNVALPLRQRKNNVSYREPSGSETDEQSCGRSPIKQSQRPSRKRRRVTYREDKTESDQESLTGTIEHHPTASHHRRQHDNAKSSPLPTTAKIKGRRPAQSRSNFPALGAKRTKKPTKLQDGRKETEAQNFDVFQLGGKVPAWHTLPYAILLQIFQYASYPLVTEAFEPASSIEWLYRTARICKGFAEPALSALYYAPPMCPPSRAQNLLASLKQQHDGSYLDYQAKVRYLDLEGISLLGRKYDGQEPVELGELLAVTPQVRGIGIHLLSDLPAWHKTTLRSIIQGKRRVYQGGMFNYLEHGRARLLEWTWNATLALQSHVPTTTLRAYFQLDSFRMLKKLVFVNSIQRDDMKTYAEATTALPNLRQLELKNISFEDEQSLTLLPTALELLDMSNCTSLTSIHLNDFLSTHGGNLRAMILNHNDSLDLVFLANLNFSCPRLETLKIDMRFYNSHYTYRDSEPKFDTLLNQMDRPAWPQKLQRIELFHLRKWDNAAAHTFFSSIVDSAECLPDLRYIDIKASLNESGWRERISFRNKWVNRIEKVFRRTSLPPDTRLTSISTFQAHREEFHRLTAHAAAQSVSGFRPASMGQKNRMVEEGANSTFTHVEVDSLRSKTQSGDSDAPLASKRRSTRLTDRSENQINSGHVVRHHRRRRRRRRRAEDSSSSEEDSALEDLNNHDDMWNQRADRDDKDMFIQGKCDVVRVVIDNLRPTEEHLEEKDFLDEEISGDEDWNEDD